MLPSQRLIVSCFVCAVALGASPHAHAADPAASDALTDKAAALYDEGFAATKQSKWATARASFLAAWALKKHWQIAASLGDCEAHLELYRDAAEHLAYFLRTAPPERRSAAAKEAYTKARSKVGTLSITVDTPGADVVVDGEGVGKAPLLDPVFVAPGRHSVEARLGAKRAVDEGDVAVGGDRAVTLKLVEAVVAPPPPPSPPPPPPPPPPKRSPVPAIVAGGLAVGAAAAGIAFVVVSNNKEDAARMLADMIDKDHGRCVAPGQIDSRCSELKSTARDVDAFQRVGLGAFVGAGVLAAGAVTYLLWPVPKAKKSSVTVHVAPVLGAGQGGMVVKGAF